ncbi:opsin-1-like [Parasteatoda tepidariorum]|uniref:opsin-1-like n=1 Tax=Parasteatoda tepidariorum TaxID=114398 RepID=UPI00077FAFCA|nr:opsin-1-like [Parasteatoda tepidariorum]
MFQNSTEIYQECLHCEDNSYRRSLYFNIFGSILSAIIALVAVIGNGAVTLVSFWDQNLRSQTGNILIVYLAVTDIFTALFIIFPSSIAVAADYWPLGSVFCRMTTCFNCMFLCSSSFNISLVSLDRVIAVLFPLKYDTWISVSVLINVLICLFLVTGISGLVCGVPGWSLYKYTEGTCAIDYINDFRVAYLYTYGFSMCYVLPAILVAICYIKIIIAAKKSAKVNPRIFCKRNEENIAISQASHTNKTVKSMIVVVCVYYFCYTPYCIANETKVLTGKDMPPWLNYMSTILVYVSSAVNPFIYGILRKDFRNAFRKLPRMIRDKILYFRI